MVNKSAIVLYLTLTLTLVGCGSVGNRFAGTAGTAPLYPVIGNSLQPAGSQGTFDNNNPQQAFAINEPENKAPVTRQTIIGAWTVSTADTNCQMFLALTKWAQGFRAASRACVDATLSDIQAWDVQNDTVMLFNSTGQQSAILYRTGDERYDGVTLNGVAISFTR